MRPSQIAYILGISLDEIHMQSNGPVDEDRLFEMAQYAVQGGNHQVRREPGIRSVIMDPKRGCAVFEFTPYNRMGSTRRLIFAGALPLMRPL